MTIDRAPKPCLHKRANHQHGTKACYGLDRCRCLPCCQAISVYEQNRKKRNAYGRSNLVDAAPAREHVRQLMAAGVGLKTIVKRCGVSQGSLWKLMHGKNGGPPSQRVTRSVADRLLSLRPGDLSLYADRARIDSLGTLRRLRALACLGWSLSRISVESGVDYQALHGAMRKRGTITARNARLLAIAYDRLSMQAPGARDRFEQAGVTRTVTAAKASGWAPPLAWDDESIDDPQATPDRGWRARREDGQAFDEIAIERAMHGDRVHLRPVERAEAVRRLTARGLSAKQIGQLLGVDKRSAQRLRAGSGEAA